MPWDSVDKFRDEDVTERRKRSRRRFFLGGRRKHDNKKERECQHDFYTYGCGCKVCRICDGYIFNTRGWQECTCRGWWSENELRPRSSEEEQHFPKV